MKTSCIPRSLPDKNMIGGMVCAVGIFFFSCPRSMRKPNRQPLFVGAQKSRKGGGILDQVHYERQIMFFSTLAEFVFIATFLGVWARFAFLSCTLEHRVTNFLFPLRIFIRTKHIQSSSHNRQFSHVGNVNV